MNPHRKLPVLFLLAWFFSFASVAAAEDPGSYLRGYVQALLDSRYPGLGLYVKAVEPDNKRVKLSSRTCLGPSQKRNIEHLLIQSERVDTIAWDASVNCDKPPTPPPDKTAEKEIFATLDIRALPEEELFATLLADPRQPRFSVSYQHYYTATTEFTASGVAFGEYFGLASGFFGEAGSSQIGIQGAVFALFNLDAPSSDLINADYWIGLPLSYRKGPWSYLLRLYHQSSHLGDEFILGNPGVNRVNLSYEDLEGLVSYEWERWRMYGGGGYFLHTDPDLARKHVHGGIEYNRPKAVRELNFIAAIDVRASEELNWRSSRSYQAGFEFKSNSPRRVRLMLEYFRGHSPNGQFYRESLRYAGLGLYFGF